MFVCFFVDIQNTCKHYLFEHAVSLYQVLFTL